MNQKSTRNTRYPIRVIGFKASCAAVLRDTSALKMEETMPLISQAASACQTAAMAVVVALASETEMEDGG